MVIMEEKRNTRNEIRMWFLTSLKLFPFFVLLSLKNFHPKIGTSPQYFFGGPRKKMQLRFIVDLLKCYHDLFKRGCSASLIFMIVTRKTVLSHNSTFW